jgi:hypothetical protein
MHMADISLRSFVSQVRAMASNSTGGRSNRGGFGILIMDPPAVGDASSPSASVSTSKQCVRAAMYDPIDLTPAECVVMNAHMYPAGDRMYKHVDEVSFSVYSEGDNACKVRAYSTTVLVSAHCDSGRNYANLEGILHALGLVRYQQTTLFGCPQVL